MNNQLRGGRRRSGTNAIAAALALALVLVACGGGDEASEPDDTPDTTDTTDAPADESGDDQDEAASDGEIDENAVIVVDVTNEPDSIDPLYRNSPESVRLSWLVYSRLHRWDEETQQIAPDVAELPEISEDGLVYTMKIRDDVTFHDGTPLTIEDVVFTYETVLNPESGTIWTGNLTSVESVEALDDETLQITLHTPNRYLRTASIPIVSAGTPYVVNETYAQTANGSGPFKLKDYQAGQYIELERHDGFHGDLPEFAGLRLEVVNENATRVARLANGESHLAPEIPADQLPLLEERGINTAVVEENNARLWVYPSMGEGRPTTDENFRQALNYAIDRGAIIDQVYGGAARSNATYLAYGSMFHDEELGSAYGDAPDLDKAREHLEMAAIQADGPLQFIVPNNPELVNAATIIQSGIQQLDIEVNIEVMDLGAMVARMMAHDYDLSIFRQHVTTTVGFAPDYPSAGLMCGSPSNINQFCDPEIDELIDVALAAPDDEAEAAWQAFQARDLEMQGQMQIVVTQHTEAWSPRLRGYEPSKLAWLNNLPGTALLADE